MESTSSEPVVPLLADALTVLMQSLIQEAAGHRDFAEVPEQDPRLALAHMTKYATKSELAFKISRLVDDYRKGKLA